MKLVNIKLSKDENSVIIIDQTALPNEIKYLELFNATQCFEAIFKLKVRGAPAIGIFAGYACYVLARSMKLSPYNDFKLKFLELTSFLNSSRPTAVNLSWAIARMLAVVDHSNENNVIEKLRNEAFLINNEDKLMCKAISEAGLSLIKDNDGILTHCNAGPLATSEYGTALGPILLAQERGLNVKVFADETRPLLQGARLTAFELNSAGVDVTLICDNMASIVMKSGKINACFVGADRIASNGDTANKIGTSGVAILAKYYKIPVYVFAPSSTVDFTCKSGADIEIELRDGNEIAELYYTKRMAPIGVKTYNPAFDVTDHSLIAGIVTEKGVLRPPFSESLKALK
ncbi:MAG: S-methyl-5-thioribose-1-phosphate isomerase [Clostridia bacterium]